MEGQQQCIIGIEILLNTLPNCADDLSITLNYWDDIMIAPWIIEELEKAEQNRQDQNRPVAQLPCMESLYDERDEGGHESTRGVKIVDISPRSEFEIEI